MLLLAVPMRQIHLDAAQAAKLQLKSLQRFDGLIWFCIIVLAGTGLLQMSSHPNYQGFLEFGNRWSTTILIKHLLFLVMVLFSAHLTWGLTPKLERLTLLNTQKGEQIREQVPSYHKESTRMLTRKINALLTINLFFGTCVLALTALARVS